MKLGTGLDEICVTLKTIKLILLFILTNYNKQNRNLEKGGFFIATTQARTATWLDWAQNEAVSRGVELMHNDFAAIVDIVNTAGEVAWEAGVNFASQTRPEHIKAEF